MNRAYILRTERHLTQQEVSDAIGVDKLTYHRFENGKVQTKLDTLEKLADYYEVSIDYLIGRSDDPTWIKPGMKMSDFVSMDKAAHADSIDEFPKDIQALSQLIECLIDKALDARDTNNH